MEFIDLHFHTSLGSPCSSIKLSEVQAIINERNPRFFVVTDHENIDAYFALRSGFTETLIVPAREIAYLDLENGWGADFTIISSDADSLLELPLVISNLDDLNRYRVNGFITWVHPLVGSGLGGGIYNPKLIEDFKNYIDAIEILNGNLAAQTAQNPGTPHFNLMAQEIGKNYNLEGSAGSDSHTIEEYGNFGILVEDENTTVSKLIETLKLGKYYITNMGG